MITDVFKVKINANKQDGLSASQPDADFDSSKGYYVGFILLVGDGETWVCDDDTVAAAVWTQDTSLDLQIDEVIRKLTELIPRYCNQWWSDAKFRGWDTNLAFTEDTISKSGEQFTDYFFDGDTLWIEHSRRNDGVYDIVSVDDETITVSPNTLFAMTDTNNVLLFAAIYPNALRDIAARMAWFDVYVRPNRTPGVTSESIGSYSYSKDVTVAGINYPEDVVAGIAQYKRPKVY